MFDIPKGIDLSKTDSYVVKVKGEQIEIEKNTSYGDKAANFFGRHFYSDGWSYKTSKVKDVIDAEMQKVIKQDQWLAAKEKNALKQRRTVEREGVVNSLGNQEKTLMLSMQLQNLKYLQQWVVDKQHLQEDKEASIIEPVLSEPSIKKDETPTPSDSLEKWNALIKNAEDGCREALLKLNDHLNPSNSEAFIQSHVHFLLTAFQFCTESAKQGNIESLYELASLYKIVELPEKPQSRDQQRHNAQINKAMVAIFPGDEKSADKIAAYYYQQAYRSYEEAADKGCGYACYQLGRLNEETEDKRLIVRLLSIGLKKLPNWEIQTLSISWDV